MSFNWFWFLQNLCFYKHFNDFLIKNSGYAFLIRLDLLVSMSLWKEFQLQILNNLSIRHLIKPILYENDVKLLKFKRSPVYMFDMFEELDFGSWYPKWIYQKKQWNGICFSIVNLMLGCLLFKKIKKFNGSCSLSKAARLSSTYPKKI